MIIRYNTNEREIAIVNRFDLRLVSNKVEKYIDVGAKTLPINLDDVFNKGLTICQSNFVTSSVYINNNNNIEKNNNILYNDIYTTCHKNTITIEDLKNKAKNNLIDVHYFPVKYTKNNENKENAYLDYNLRWAMVSMLEMEQALQWLVGYNENVQFIVENRDIEKTLWSVANRLSNNEYMKKMAIRTIMGIYETLDAKYIASKFQDFWWNIDWFIGKNRYLQHVTHFETMEKNRFVGVYLYGSKREDSWRNITHRLDDSVCLFIDNQTKMMMKRIKDSMSGQKFHDYLKEMIGNWFDLDNKQIWAAIRQNMHRISDSKLDEMYDVETCKLYVKNYFDNMSEYYNLELVDLSNEADQKIIAENTIIENNISTPSVVENVSELQETQRTAIVDEYIEPKNNTIDYINNTYEQYSWQWYDAMIQNGFMPVEM